MCNVLPIPDDDSRASESQSTALHRLDMELQRLIQMARCYPDTSSDRRKTIHSLIYKMQQSGAIQSGDRADDAYAEALQRTWIWFAKNCCQFDPQQAKDPDAATVIGWFKHYLYRYKLREVQIEQRRMREREVSATGLHPQGDLQDLIDRQTTAELIQNQQLERQQNPAIELERRERVTLLRHCIEELSLLRTKYVPNYPQIHCQLLLLRRLPRWDESTQTWIPEQDWEELEQDLKISRQQLRACYEKYRTDKRCLERLSTCLNAKLSRP